MPRGRRSESLVVRARLAEGGHAIGAVPFAGGHGVERRPHAAKVPARVAGVAEQDRRVVVARAARHARVRAFVELVELLGGRLQRLARPRAHLDALEHTAAPVPAYARDLAVAQGAAARVVARPLPDAPEAEPVGAAVERRELPVVEKAVDRLGRADRAQIVGVERGDVAMPRRVADLFGDRAKKWVDEAGREARRASGRQREGGRACTCEEGPLGRSAARGTSGSRDEEGLALIMRGAATKLLGWTSGTRGSKPRGPVDLLEPSKAHTK